MPIPSLRSKHSALVISVPFVIYFLIRFFRKHVCGFFFFERHIFTSTFNKLIAYHFCCRAPPCIPEVHLPEEPFLQIASAFRIELNHAFAVLRSIASGRDLKSFLMVCAFSIHLICELFSFLLKHELYCCYWSEGKEHLICDLYV